MGQIQIEQVSTDHAAQALARAGVADPRCENSPADIARGGTCLRFVAEEGACVFVARQNGGVFFVDGAASEGGAGLASVGLVLAEASARQAACTRVVFETTRPGLVRLARKRGYRIAGFIMEKEV